MQTVIQYYFFVKLHPSLHTVVTPGLYGNLFLLHHLREQQDHCRCVFVILCVFRLLNNSHNHRTINVKTVMLLSLAPSWSIVYGYHCWVLFLRAALQLYQWNLWLLLKVVMSTTITDTSLVRRRSTAVACKYVFNHFLLLPQQLNSVTQPLHGGIQEMSGLTDISSIWSSIAIFLFLRTCHTLIIFWGPGERM